MCFSATASFAAAAGLGAVGVLTIREAKSASQLPLAAMPLLFGVQQAVEGVVWLSSGSPWLQTGAAFVYIMFSHVLWPFYVPLAVGALEPPGRRKSALRVLLIFGVALSSWLAAYVVRGPITASLATGCVIYDMTLPPIPYGLAAYVFATCFPCLISSHKFIRVLGWAAMGALSLALWAYQEAFYSTWCFFSAILSAIIYAHLRQDLRLWPVAASLKARVARLTDRS
ncbi:MAG: DUF6629 family protein [Patescibacteria group bacterium]|jgi:hypothetical protein